MSHTQSPPSQAVDALAALRRHYLANSAPRTVAQLRELGARLTEHPEAPEVLTAVRRELHRVRGTSGTYGFTEAAALCGAMEVRALAWAEGRDRQDAAARGRALATLADALDAAFAGTPARLDTAPTTPGELPAAAESALASPRADHAGDAAGDAPDVIVVEDDADLARMLEFSLETANTTYRTFSTGTEAVAALLAMPRLARRPVVLLDIDLPGIDGHSVHERLAAERPGEFGVVFMTSHAAETEQLRAYRGGALDYVVKPLSLRVLLAKLPVWRRAADRG